MSCYRVRKVHTNTPLEADGVFTSPWVKVDYFERITGIAFADEDGSLVIEQSIDGVNADYEHTAITVTGDTGKEFDVKIYGEYFRLIYTNGTNAQTVFRMAAYATPMGG